MKNGTGKYGVIPALFTKVHFNLLEKENAERLVNPWKPSTLPPIVQQARLFEANLCNCVKEREALGFKLR